MKKHSLNTVIFMLLLLITTDIFAVEIQKDLYLAAKNGDLNRIKELIAKGAKVNYYEKTYPNYNPLNGAVLGEQIAVARYLLKHGANPNLQGTSSLFDACRLKDNDMIQLLINYGAEIKKITKDKKPQYALSFYLSAYHWNSNRDRINSGTVLLLLNKTGKIDWQQIEDYDNPFIWAIHHHIKLAVLKKFMENGAIIKRLDQADYRTSALYITILAGHYQMLRYLIEEKKLDIHSELKNGDFPLHYACTGRLSFEIEESLAEWLKRQKKEADDRYNTVLYLIEKLGYKPGQKTNNDFNNSGSLSLAAAWWPKITQYYANNYKIDVNENFDRGTPPIAHAIKHGNSESFQLLLKKGAKLNKHFFNAPIAFLAAKGGSPEIITILAKKGFNFNLIKNKQGTLYLAASNGHFKAVKRLIQLKIKYPKPGVDSYSILNVAVQANNISMVLFLLRNGGNVNEKDANGRTSLHYACQFSNDTMVKLLLRRQAEVNSRDQNGNTPIYKLLSYNRKDKQKRYLILNLLLKAKARVTIRNKNLETPLHCYLNNYGTVDVKIIKALIVNGVDINAKDNQGNTALFSLVTKGSTDKHILDLLLKSGTQINAMNNKGETPLDMVRPYNKSIIAIMKKNGAKYGYELLRDKKFQKKTVTYQHAVKYITQKGFRTFKMKKAPNILVTDLQGKKRSLNYYRGKIIFLNFWATWCGPCVSEMPFIEKLHQAMKGKNFVILAVSSETAVKVSQFVKRNQLTFPIATSNSYYDFNVTGIPTTFIIDKNGNILGRYVGSKNWGDMNMINLFKELSAWSYQ